MAKTIVIYQKYLFVVLRHKWFVFLECCKLGIPWRGITHDLGKFLPIEFVPYAQYSYGLWGNDKPQWLIDAFAMALLHHWNSNTHHYQYWIDRPDHSSHYREIFKQSGIVQNGVFKMPETCVREMLADWRGAGRVHGDTNVSAWYAKNKTQMQLHSATQDWIEAEMELA